MSIVITCANSKTSTAALRTLAQQKHPDNPLKAVVRSAEKGDEARKLGAEVVVADLSDSSGLADAFRGAKAVYVMHPPNFGAQDPIAEAKKIACTLKTAIDSAKPKRVVVLSSWGADIKERSGVVHTVAILEDALAKSAEEVVFLRATGFYENALGGLPFIKQCGMYSSTHIPVHRPFKSVATEDVGRAVARHLVTPFPASAASPRVVYVTGPTDPTATDIGNAIGSALGQEVKTVPVPDAQLEEFFGRFLPPSFIPLMATMVRAVNSDAMTVPEGAEVERGTVTLEDFFKEAVPA